MPSSSFVITIDGPAASGKGTLAKRLAATLGFYCLDSGAIYRLLGLRLLQNGINPDEERAVVQEAQKFIREFDIAQVHTPDIRTSAVADATSRSSIFIGVRDALRDVQRNVAKAPPAPFKGVVLEGRDMGTVICPEADLKVFLTASSAARAQRRTKELLSRGETVTYDAVLQDLEERDLRDSTRLVAPLKPAEDAAIVDTSGMDADAALAYVLSLVRERLSNTA
jgi:cytidylate kinase